VELTIDRESFLDKLSLLSSVTERRNTVTILGHVLLEPNGATLKLSATDLEVGVRTEVHCESNLDLDASRNGQHAFTLSARKLHEAVREAEGDTLAIKTLDNDWIEAKCGRARFKMMSLNPAEFPAIPGVERGESATELKIDAAVLNEMIEKTIIAVSPDDYRPHLSGVYLEGDSGTVRMVATDGHRIALIERDIPSFTMPRGAIIPRKGLVLLKKVLDELDNDAEVALVLDGQHAGLSQGSTEISMRLIDGEFPEYRKVIPKEPRHQVRVMRDALLNSIKRAAILLDGRHNSVKLKFSDGSLEVSAFSLDRHEASETLDCDFSGEDFEIGFNVFYLQQGLGVMPAESEAVLGLSEDAAIPTIMTTLGDAKFQYVVMPMRL
jgi:DNA polymerase III subunit beta